MCVIGILERSNMSDNVSENTIAFRTRIRSSVFKEKTFCGH